MTTATTPIALPRLSPKTIDDLCLAYDDAKAKLELAQAAVNEAKDALLPFVRAYGFIPAGAEKTKRLEGTLYVADSTVTTTTKIVESAVVDLMFELIRRKKSKLFHDVFEPNTKHVLRKNGGELLALGIAAMKEADRTHILSIYARCFDAESKAPTLSVDLVEALKQREEEAAAKAATKAAKAAKKAAKNGGSK